MWFISEWADYERAGDRSAYMSTYATACQVRCASCLYVSPRQKVSCNTRQDNTTNTLRVRFLIDRMSWYCKNDKGERGGERHKKRKKRRTGICWCHEHLQWVLPESTRRGNNAAGTYLYGGHQPVPRAWYACISCLVRLFLTEVSLYPSPLWLVSFILV